MNRHIMPVFVDHYNEVMAVIHSDSLDKLEQAGKFVSKVMKDEAPVQPRSTKQRKRGELKKSVRYQLDKNNFAVKVIAGNKKAWYVHLVLWGTAARWTYLRGKRVGRGRQHIGKGMYRGIMPENNFMQRAFDKSIFALTQIFGKAISAVIKTKAA